MSPKASKTWVFVAAIGAAVLLLSAISGVWFYLNHVERIDATPEQASTILTETLRRFDGQRPRLTLDEHRHIRLTERIDPSTPPRRISGVHVLTWNSVDRKVTTIEIPVWMLRLRLRGNSATLDTGETVEVSETDLQRLGTALLLDHQENGRRFVVWSE